MLHAEVADRMNRLGERADSVQYLPYAAFRARVCAGGPVPVAPDQEGLDRVVHRGCPLQSAHLLGQVRRERHDGAEEHHRLGTEDNGVNLRYSQLLLTKAQIFEVGVSQIPNAFMASVAYNAGSGSTCPDEILT